MTDADLQRESERFILRVGGETWQLPRYCPHRGGRLDYGLVNTERLTIACPLHRSVFCLRTGRQLSGPPCGELTSRRLCADTESSP
jgi:nitrite reductase/ring-hydroxylating ferredoxin subunit